MNKPGIFNGMLDCCKGIEDTILVTREWLTEVASPSTTKLLRDGTSSRLLASTLLPGVTRCLLLGGYHVKVDEDGCYTLPNGECIGPACQHNEASWPGM